MKQNTDGELLPLSPLLIVTPMATSFAHPLIDATAWATSCVIVAA